METTTPRSGRVERDDTLILATGSDPFVIPVPRHDLQGVVYVGAMRGGAGRAVSLRSRVARSAPCCR
ncbi:hypothetical protein E2E30_18485 [Sphingomonas sp. AAP5]|nr:hypothetical protein E2E30_18485 [Sphingomonas sp. AAP5]